MAKAGRPRIEVDKAKFEKLCGIQCTLEEIASVLDCSEDTIQRWCMREYHENFAVVHKKFSGVGKMSLRRAQFKMAEKSASMAIWLGKQYLGQKDVVETEFNPESLTRAYELLAGVSSVIN